MMRVLLFGAPVDQPQAGTNLEKFSATGYNTGNLLIGHGLLRQIAYSTYSFGIGRDATNVDKEFDFIAVPAANFIFKGFDFSDYAAFLEKTTLPVLVVGLGAQMPSFSDANIEIPSGTKRFLKILSERAVSLGVRGEFTANVLDRLGITNVTITGCPSYYWNKNKFQPILKKPFSFEMNISVNGSRNVYEHSFNPDAAKKVESDLIRLSMLHRYDYVLQNEEPEIDILSGDDISDELRQSLATLIKRHDLATTIEDYHTYIRRNCKIFFSIDEWMNFIRRKDISIGTRFHGNLIALLNGVPALLFAHDSRTSEMADFMRIPCARVDQVDIGKLEQLYDEADFSAFSRTYIKNYSNYVDFLDRSGIKHNCLR